MSKETILEYFNTNSTNLGIMNILMMLVGGLLIGLIIYGTYWVSYKGVAYNRKFNLSLIVLLEISIVIMLMISSNIVISLGMVGALSIVRFRTAIKDSRDTVFIFWAIAEGLCVGSQNLQLAIITTAFIAIIIVMFDFIPRVFNKYLVVIRADEKVKIEDILTITEKYTSDRKVRNINKSKENQEFIIEIKTRGELKPELIKELSEISGMDSVNYIVETGEDLG